MPELNRKKSSITAPVTPHVWELEGEPSNQGRAPSPAPSTRSISQKQAQAGRTTSQMAEAATVRYSESAAESTGTVRRISTDSEALTIIVSSPGLMI